MRIEILADDGKVINTIIADAEFAEAEYPGKWRAAELPAPAPEPVKRQISVGAFFDRFKDKKWAILADTNPVVQAVVKDCSVRNFIDLDRKDLPAGLQVLVAAGHAIDVNAIIGAPAKPEERTE